MHQITQRLSSSVQSIFNAAEIRLINRPQTLPSPSIKGNQSVGAKSHCIYQFTCDCGNSYIGRTDRCLKSRIKEHLPKWVLRAVESGPQTETTRRLPASSIARHLLTSCHKVNPDNAFRVLLSHPNPTFLRFAEAVAINNLRPPPLCAETALCEPETAMDLDFLSPPLCSIVCLSTQCPSVSSYMWFSHCKIGIDKTMRNASISNIRLLNVVFKFTKGPKYFR